MDHAPAGQPADTTTVTVDHGPSSREVPDRAPHAGRPVPLLALLVPMLILFNLVAMFGQGSYLYDHVAQETWDPRVRLAVAVGFALAIELVGVLLAALAHDAAMDDQPSAGIRAGSYLVGIGAGAMNFGHFYSPSDVSGTVGTAVGFALLSAASPFLWALWSSAANKARRKALGDYRRRGVRLSPARKFWHPVRSVRVMAWAAWAGVGTEEEAVRGWELMGEAPAESPVSPAPGQRTKEEWWREALALWAEEPTLTQRAVAERLGISTRWLRECDPARTGTGRKSAAQR